MNRPWVALVGPELEENLSLRYLASSLRAAGFESQIFAFNDPSALPRLVEKICAADRAPLLVGLSMAFQWRAPDFLALAMGLRERGYQGHITAGGHFATFECESLLRDFPEVDSVCRHESEETLVELAQAVQRRVPFDSLKGLCVRDAEGKPRINDARATPNLSALPWPDRSGEPASCFAHRISPLVSTRGCYANCAFCCIAAWHEATTPGKRYRERPLEDVAEEMVAMQRERGIEIFVFHDDNFFLPGWRKNVDRFNKLADALEARGMGKFATVVKARPTDAHPEVFRILRDRLHCIRIYVGIETDADQGLDTLQRWANARHNRISMAIVKDLELYTCFNMLVFDPDTTVESFETNLEFMDAYAEHPFNFGRTELYAGTPLLTRMKAERRVRGDWLQWDYSLASVEVERLFRMSTDAFGPRNFGEQALANALMGLRFDIEVCRKFHADRFDERWLSESKDIVRALGKDSVRALRLIVDRVKTTADAKGDAAFAESLSPGLREVEAVLRERSRVLAEEVHKVIGQGESLTLLGIDKVATSLQRARPKGEAAIGGTP